ncbi:MAG: BMP family ABC transporter substrate-binding protein [Chloroflexi bacterium CFX1]|nr:BMP family ABC transporter substrate-binding protein [Chloroflexi bacterium CFX1]MCK6567097.1 BMP family ABC transporter substrate-binding protein [Anaerolineales bacterium]MCQ3953375.1 BMP family ABC transporter substrate-binding protein [Chloroflexota bacterium]MDL1918856.1 BMP family ABC transporter substrate-binding protein [Chloroflexi bacterium CFX5]NUQ59419.1 BMP family ABC transporter substrate-binding protein [Anaerolineales bacterium]
MRTNFARLAMLFMALMLVLSACGGQPAATEEAAPATEEAAPSEGGFQIPEIEEGKFNVAAVMIGPHDDGGWSQAHYEGLLYVEENVENVHVAYIENVPEGADSEQVFRSLARKGFNLILGTSFGYMDPMEVVAGEFPDTMFIHLTGIKSNETNFGNLMGAMEDMKYLAGMLAGARAKKDGNTKLGYMATFPIPEEVRLGNAIALGMRKTCPECTMDVRWINTWHDPVIEKEAAASLFDAGAQVVFTGADTPAVADVAQEKGKWGVTYDWYGSCKVDACLTAPYWVWGPVYADITEQVIAGTYKPGWHYFDADTGALGLYGFMEGQEMQPGVKDLDPAVIAEVQDILAKMLAGEFDRFDVFTGPINDNQGNVVLPEGQSLQQVDLDAFPEFGLPCSIDVCMKWWAEGVTAELPE